MENISLYDIIVSYFCLVFALSVHEAAHAIVADWRGDSTPRMLGRVTLNPIAHLDPFGSVIIPLVMMFMTPWLFGWGKPVTFIPRNLKDPARDSVLIALAGPFSNLILALTAAVALRIVAMVVGAEAIIAGMPLGDVLFQLVVINLLLMLFNLIPLPPLDGYSVVNYFLPPGGQRILASIGPFGILVAILIVNRTPILTAPLQMMIVTLRDFALYGSFSPPV